MLNMKFFLVLLALIFSSQVFAVTISDDFTQATDSNSWTPLGYACLTAGTGSGSSTSIPGCNYTTPDAAGSGALRLTPSVNNQSGAIVSTTPFSSSQGMQVTFTTYTYGGDSGGTGKQGADGMSFFLVGNSQAPPASAGTNLGSFGGSLGYSCSNSNTPYTGLTGAYLGLGMDEYGNFLNSGDNTASGIQNTNSSGITTNGTNTFTTGNNYYQPNRIGLRGAGNISWYWLNQNYPLYYPSSLSASTQKLAVQSTCKTGTLWNYSTAQNLPITGTPTVSGNAMTVTVSSTSGYSIGDSVTLSGITATAPTQNISGTPALSNGGATMTVTVPSTSGYVKGNNVTIGGTITSTTSSQSVNSYSNYSSNTVRVNLSNTSGFSSNGSVTISGASGSNASCVNGTHTISNVTGSYLKINLSCSWSGSTSFPSGGTIPGSTASITGSYVISSVNTTNNTFTVALAPASSITNTSGIATLPTATLSGPYTITALTANTFTVALPSAVNTITNTSGTALDNSLPGSPANTSTAIMDYPVIPGGYWVLPNAQLIADEGASIRANAWPITYRLIITSGGLLTYMYSYNGGAFQSVLTNFPITTGNGPLPANFLFGFAGSTGGSRNVHEITCFLAQTSESASSAGANTVQAGQIRTGTQVYLASYNPNNWSGSLGSYALTASTNGVISVATNANWDGGCVLTGGACRATGSTANTSAEAISGTSGRQLLTWNGTGISLTWGSLSSAQQAILNTNASNVIDSDGSNRLSWLRGDRTNEPSPTGAVPAIPLRVRAGVLGDIVDSSPTWVGPPALNYSAIFTDSLYGTTGNESVAYSSYSSAKATRTNVVYVGANDGLLHGFRAGNNNADGSYNSTNNDGLEIIGFMPSTVLANANVTGLTSTTYAHNYFVDAAPGNGDLFYNGQWHTWLVGGLGAGGAEIYALDITDPAQFSETNASALVVGDWTSSALGSNLGQLYGTPIIRRLHNGQWAIIFGNGINSQNGTAGVFIGLVSQTTGAVTFKWLGTSSTTSNGIEYVSSADLDGDHITDYLYAGDLLGNVWRFDLTSNKPADWVASTFGHASATPLFTATNSSGGVQPITTKIAVTSTNTGGAQRILLGFGTGSASPFTSTSATSYAANSQTVYGIWDWDMANWNNGTTTTATTTIIPASPVKYAALPESTAPPYLTFNRSNLLANSVFSQTATIPATSTSAAIPGTRTVAISTVCWQGSTNCTSGNTQYGWMFDLPDTVTTPVCGSSICNEQIIYSPVFSGGELILNTTIPPANSATQCTPLLPTGWTMAFNMASGGGNLQNVFPNSSGSLTVASGSASIGGLQQNSGGSPYVVSVGSKQYIVNSNVDPTIKATVNPINTQGGVNVKRVSWEVLR